MSEIIIIGAGAIGRGYLPWVFKNENFKLTFVDVNTNIISLMKQNKTFKTYRVVNNQLETLDVNIHRALTFEEFNIQDFKSVNSVFINVGPRNVKKVSQKLVGTTFPIILCENDPDSVKTVKSITNNNSVFFAVPDVITNNTASDSLLELDPLSIVTENGELFVDDDANTLKGDIKFISEKDLIDTQWTAKLYLHNTPHCIAAYLGALVGAKYVHEAMAVPEIEKIVKGAMVEMLNSLKLKWDIPHPFLEWYAEKEIQRFSCKLLFDPISRVAREPLRKLELDGRLIGAAQICLSLGFIPNNILLGIVSALLFDDPQDNDRHLYFMRSALTPTSFLTHVLGLREGEALEQVLKLQMDSCITQLNELAGTSKGNK